MFRSKGNSTGLITDSGEEIKYGDVVTIEIRIPEKAELKVGRIDKLMSDLQKDGLIKSVKTIQK